MANGGSMGKLLVYFMYNLPSLLFKHVIGDCQGYTKLKESPLVALLFKPKKEKKRKEVRRWILVEAKYCFL